MDREIDILQLADGYEKFEEGNSSAYLIINKKIRDYQALFGFAKLSPDKGEWRELFHRMEEAAMALGHKTLVGPVNYSTWLSYRWAISRFDLSLFPDCDNPPFYPEYIEELGYRKLYTYRSAEIRIANPLNEPGAKALAEKEGQGYHFVAYEGEEALLHATSVYEISREAFSDAPLYSDIPYAVFETLYLSWVKKLHISLIIAYYGKDAVGYVFGYESPLGRDFISKTSAVKKAHQKHGLYLALLHLGSELVSSKGYDTMFYHFQCEQKQTFRRFESSIEAREKRYAVYMKELV